MQSGTNLLCVRGYNEMVILEAIRRGSVLSRVELAQQTGLTAQTISNVVKRLLDQGLIREDGKSATGVGKHRIRLKINPDAGYAIGVQIERYETIIVVIDLLGQVIAKRRLQTKQEQGPQAVLKRVTASINQLIWETGISREKVIGLGVACPGPLNHIKGIVHDAPDLTGWHNLPLKDILEKETGFMVIVDKDATAAAVGEQWARRHEDLQSFAFFYVGVGIGAGLFIEKRIYRGSTTMAGAIGHTTLDPHGPLCSCGNRGCMGIPSAPRAVIAKVKRRLQEGTSSTLTAENLADDSYSGFRAIGQAAIQGDTLAKEELERSARWQGYAIVNLVNTLDIELVVIGGTYMEGAVGEFYVKEIEQVLQERILAHDQRTVRVESSVVGKNVGAIGAASLVLHSIYTPQLRALKTLDAV